MAEYEYIKYYFSDRCAGMPALMLYEVDSRNERHAVRMCEVTRERKVIRADDEGFGYVTEAPVPTVDEINRESSEYYAETITADEFGRIYGAETYPGGFFRSEAVSRTCLGTGRMRVIKIGREALREFVYEKFIEAQGEYFRIDPLRVSDCFDIDPESGSFFFGVYDSEDAQGDPVPMPDIDMKALMKKLPDTADSMFKDGRYREYDISELEELSKKRTNGNG